MSSPGTEPRPILKWAGGKRQLLPAFRPFYPPAPRRYFEPFLGSAAVFFDLWNEGRLNASRIVLSDGNADLIGVYRRVRDSVDAVVEALAGLAERHRCGGRDHYYKVRNEEFNPARARWRAGGSVPEQYSPALAAMLLYLNRTGYNGLFRQNASGGYNVPAGRYAHPRILDAELLRAVSSVLRDGSVDIRVAPFEAVRDEARAGDFVYFDPPYAPISATARFRSYTARGFDEADQRHLREVVVALARSGVQVLVSNSVTPETLRLYEDNLEVRRAGLRTWRVPARRAINSRASGRGPIDELLVSNVEPAYAPASQTKRSQLGQAYAMRRSCSNDT